MEEQRKDYLRKSAYCRIYNTVLYKQDNKSNKNASICVLVVGVVNYRKEPLLGLHGDSGKEESKKNSRKHNWE